MMSTLKSNEEELRQRNTTDIEEKEDENVEEVTKIAHNINVRDDDEFEPGPITKQTMISLMIVLFSVFLDFMGASIVQPILPFYAEMFNANSTELGALYSSYSAMSLLAALFMGKFSDIFGRKPMICFSLFGTCIGFLTCALAQNYAQLLGFRFLTGIFGATTPVAMAVITDVVPSISRSKYIAATGAVITLSFIIGPGLGAGLSEFGIRVPFFVSSGLGAFGFIFAIIALKETHPIILKKQALKKRVKYDSHLKSASPNEYIEAEQEEMTAIKTMEIDNEDDGNDELDESEDEESSKIPIQVWILYIVSISTALGFTVYTSMFALYVIDLYDLSTLSVGYITLVLATVLTFANIIFIQGSKIWGMYIQIIIACFWCGISLGLAPFINNLWGFLAIVVFGVGGGYGQILPAMNATAASWTNVKNRGSILGLANAAYNLALIIGPLMHGMLYGINKSYPWFVGSVSVLFGGFVVIIMILKWPQLKYPEKTEKTEDEESEIGSLNAEVIMKYIDKDWKYIPDKVARKDYMNLGKTLGVMLSNKRYNWVKGIDRVIQLLDIIFPPMHTDSFQIRRHDINFIVSNAKTTRKQFDSLRYAAENTINL